MHVILRAYPNRVSQGYLMVYTVVSQRSAKSFSSKACSTEIDHETVLFDLESESPQRGMT